MQHVLKLVFVVSVMECFPLRCLDNLCIADSKYISVSKSCWHENMWEFVSVNVNKDSACTWPLQLLLWEQTDSCSMCQWSSVIISMLCTFLLGFHAKSVSQLSIAILLGCWISWFYDLWCKTCWHCSLRLHAVIFNPTKLLAFVYCWDFTVIFLFFHKLHSLMAFFLL